jgi:hypothetical protein
LRNGAAAPPSGGVMRPVAAAWARDVKSFTASPRDQALDFVMIGKGIAGTGTNYKTSHHAIMILEIDDDGNACIVDLDDTVKGKHDDEIIRIVNMEDLLKNFQPDTKKMPDHDGNADEPRESVVEPGGSGSDLCIIL